jgi:hypothetical protein
MHSLQHAVTWHSSSQVDLRNSIGFIYLFIFQLDTCFAHRAFEIVLIHLYTQSKLLYQTKFHSMQSFKSHFGESFCVYK